MNAKAWFKENKYDEILEQISRLEAQWKESGKGTRKDWLEIVAGGKGGAALSVNGEVFPVLKAAQIRAGKPVTKNALSKRNETPMPPKAAQARWGHKSSNPNTLRAA